MDFLSLGTGIERPTGNAARPGPQELLAQARPRVPLRRGAFNVQAGQQDFSIALQFLQRGVWALVVWELTIETFHRSHLTRLESCP